MIKVLSCRLAENRSANQIFWLMRMMILMQQEQAQSCHLTPEA